MQTRLITAICTPLAEDESLHVAGLEAHLEDQWQAGIAGLLVAGSMGQMQLLADETYRDLIDYCVRFTAGRGELMVGVGDTSFARTRDRIRLAEQFAIDAVVIVTPYLVKHTQADMIDYYRALADLSGKPVYLYTVPGFTGVMLEADTVAALSEHPNIHGIKCSVPWDWTRQLMDRVGPGFRIIPAQAHLIDQLAAWGIRENLDGIFGIAPRLTVSIAEAAERGDRRMAAERQRQLSGLLQLLITKYPLLASCTALLNARGILGNVAPRPLHPLTATQREQLLAEPLVKQAQAGEWMVASAAKTVVAGKP